MTKLQSDMYVTGAHLEIFEGKGGFQTKEHTFEYENSSMQKFEKPIYFFDTKTPSHFQRTSG